jgi:GUN4-like/TIR domain
VTLAMDYSQFDVFLCHNSKDKPQVEQIREQLKARKIYAFLDKYDFEPFRPWQKQLEEIIPRIKSAAVFLGPSGVGSWEDMEMREFLLEFVERDLRMGLVILPGCPDKLVQEVPRWLNKFHRVDFRQTTPEPMNQLVWGITGNRFAAEGDTPTEHSQTNPLGTSNISPLEKLESLLTAQKWREADEQTKELMLKDNQDKPLMAPQIRELSVELLDRIDRLWMEASDGIFGLRIQLQMWQKILEPEKQRFGGLFAKKVEPLTDSQAWNRFGCVVGWRGDDEKFFPDSKLSFSMKAPSGCFPRTRLWLNKGYGNSPQQFATLMKRVEELD